MKQLPNVPLAVELCANDSLHIEDEIKLRTNVYMYSL